MLLHLINAVDGSTRTVMLLRLIKSVGASGPSVSNTFVLHIISIDSGMDPINKKFIFFCSSLHFFAKLKSSKVNSSKKCSTRKIDD
jgi:hypothetical protein